MEGTDMGQYDDIDYKGVIGLKNRYLVQRTIGYGANCVVKKGFDTQATPL